MKNNAATIGDAKLYQKIKGFEVRATIGNSNAGYGWRPVCGGLYIGNECYPSERAAITQGKIIVDNLKRRVDAAQHLTETKPKPAKRTRKVASI